MKFETKNSIHLQTKKLIEACFHPEIVKILIPYTLFYKIIVYKNIEAQTC